jgi:hypothetical protein
LGRCDRESDIIIELGVRDVLTECISDVTDRLNRVKYAVLICHLQDSRDIFAIYIISVVVRTFKFLSSAGE